MLKTLILINSLFYSKNIIKLITYIHIIPSPFLPQIVLIHSQQNNFFFYPTQTPFFLSVSPQGMHIHKHSSSRIAYEEVSPKHTNIYVLSHKAVLKRSKPTHKFYSSSTSTRRPIRCETSGMKSIVLDTIDNCIRTSRGRNHQTSWQTHVGSQFCVDGTQFSSFKSQRIHRRYRDKQYSHEYYKAPIHFEDLRTMKRKEKNEP